MDKKEQQSIDFLRSIYQDKPLNLGFSGGKDSVVILDLAERAGIVYDAIYANTTVDPPGTINFIKKNYPQVQIIKDKELNRDFKRLGEIHSNSDFNYPFDPRWEIEKKGYEEFSCGEHYEDGEEGIVNRSIIRFKD